MVSVQSLLTLILLLALPCMAFPHLHLPPRQLLPPPTISCEPCDSKTNVKVCQKCTMVPYDCVAAPMPIPCDVDVEGGEPPPFAWPEPVPSSMATTTVTTATVAIVSGDTATPPPVRDNPQPAAWEAPVE